MLWTPFWIKNKTLTQLEDSKRFPTRTYNKRCVIQSPKLHSLDFQGWIVTGSLLALQFTVRNIQNMAANCWTNGSLLGMWIIPSSEASTDESYLSIKRGCLGCSWRSQTWYSYSMTKKRKPCPLLIFSKPTLPSFEVHKTDALECKEILLGQDMSNHNCWYLYQNVPKSTFLNNQRNTVKAITDSHIPST